MRSPSVQALKKYFHLDADRARLLKKIAASVVSGPELDYQIQNVPATARYVRSLRFDPYYQKIWRVTIALHAINELVNGAGVESFGPGRSGDYAPPYEYINFGDPYAATLIYKRSTDNLFIGNWGSIAEKHPNW